MKRWWIAEEPQGALYRGLIDFVGARCSRITLVMRSRLPSNEKCAVFIEGSKVYLREVGMPSGKLIITSIALVFASASIVDHGTCMPNGSRKTTARWCCQSTPLASQRNSAALASPS